MDIQDPKKYPNSSPEVAKMLGMQPEEHASEDVSHEQPHEHTAPAPSHLPVAEPEKHAKTEAEWEQQIAKDLAALKTHVKSSAQPAPSSHEDVESEEEEPRGSSKNWKNILKTVIPYLAIFIVGVFVFIFFFQKVDISSWFSSSPKVVSVKESALQKLQKDNLATYQTWIHEFYYSVSDNSILDPNADNSGNGLSNFQKYLLNLNPKSYDTLGLGMADSEALAKGINPLTGNPLNDSQKKIIDTYFDMEVIMNRLALAKLHNSGNVAGTSVFATSTPPSYSTFGTSSNSGIQVRSYSTQAATQSPLAVETSEPAGNVLNANDLDVDMTVPGRLQIPSLKVDAPIIWSADPANFEQDLKSGVVHYPGTAIPGQIGTTYISGHSSNYAWVKGNYNHVFTKLNNLPDNGSFSVTVTLKNGKQATLHYVVTGRKEYQPTDVAQFANSGKSVVALSTCWPVGSTAKRLVVFGELTQIER